MLVLSRRVNERILIGDSIRLTVVSTRGNQVRIGIEAPDHIRIYREEVCPEASRLAVTASSRPERARDDHDEPF